MASKFLCACGSVVRTNIYEGHGLHLLVPEELTDLPEHELREPCEPFVDRVVRESVIVAKCSNCGVLALVDKNYNITLYAPVAQ